MRTAKASVVPYVAEEYAKFAPLLAEIAKTVDWEHVPKQGGDRISDTWAPLLEVDAALDEANNERFNRIVREFVTNSQFIIITHSKWTMNVADQLYGITMQEPGVSTRVSVQLTGANVA